MRTIALIEDDPDLYELLRHTFEQRGYRFAGRQTGDGAVEFIRRSKPDLLLLDIMLPVQDGIDICRQMRDDRELQSTPVIFLTARSSETDRVLGLELGADDYVTKPFSVRELCARVKIHLQDKPERPEILRAGALELNRWQYSVTLNGRPLLLTATEFRLLEHLMCYPGQVFRRDRLLDAVWGEGRDILERSVDAYIVRLRTKLEDDPANPRWIRSVRGVGCSFKPLGSTEYQGKT